MVILSTIDKQLFKQLFYSSLVFQKLPVIKRFEKQIRIDTNAYQL